MEFKIFKKQLTGHHLTRSLFLLLILAASFTGTSAQNGKAEDHTFYSAALGKNMSCGIYLPPGYKPEETKKRYPVIISLHGASVGYETYQFIYPIIDAMWMARSIDHFILVMPDGKAEPYLGSFYTNSVLYGNYEDYLLYDLISFIDSHFNTIADRNHRGIMGHSMGSYGAFKLAFKHPESFIAVAGHSGPLNIELLDLLIPDLENENGGSPPFSWEPGPGKSLTNLAFSMAGAFSPNLNDPFFVDFPLNTDATIIPEVMERWKPHNISRLVKSLDKNISMGIYFDCGNQDDFKLQYQNRALADSLTLYDHPHQYVEYSGDHNSGLIFRIPVAFRFFDQVFKTTTGIDIIAETKPGYQVFPNPAQGRFSIESGFANKKSPARIEIADALGRQILSSEFSGTHTEFDLSQYPEGVYFIRILDSHQLVTLRLLLSQHPD